MNLNSETNYTSIANNVDTETGHFGQFPKPQIQRSRYKVPFRNTFTCNASKLIPFYWSYVMPNETFSIDTSAVIRMQPTVASPMSNIYADVYYFFVANKDLWHSEDGTGWKEFFGENKGQYVQAPLSNIQVPQLTFPTNGFEAKSVADYLGVPTEVKPEVSVTISALPMRAYAKVWNDFFRDENLSPEANVYTGSSTSTGSRKTGNSIQTASVGGDLLPVCRPHDMLGSCLPFPQKGDPTDTLISGNLSGAGRVMTYEGTNYPLLPNWTTPLKFTNGAGVTPTGDLQAGSSGLGVTGTSSVTGTVAPSNLWLNTASTSVGANPLQANITINELRQSVALQHYFEALARGGSRYYEVISSMYGTTIDPMALDRAVFLGGKRTPISITNVVQNNAAPDDTTGLGQVAGYSCTSEYDNSFTFSFSQHGIVIGVMCIRSEKQYQQGLDRNWRLKDRLEFYTPNVFDGLGEMEVLNSDIFLSGAALNKNNGVFGYQEAYYWERYKPWVVAGEMRSNYPTTLDYWHLADDYPSTPVLNGDITVDAGEESLGWIYDNTDDNLDRILQVSRSKSDQFYCDIYVDNTVVSPLPVYSIPGIATL